MHTCIRYVTKIDAALHYYRVTVYLHAEDRAALVLTAHRSCKITAHNSKTIGGVPLTGHNAACVRAKVLVIVYGKLIRRLLHDVFCKAKDAFSQLFGIGCAQIVITRW